MQRIAVLRAGALGDTILTVPALAALRATFPDAHISFTGNPALLPLLNHQPFVDETFSIDDGMLAPLFACQREVAYPLPAFLSNLDLAVIWLQQTATVIENLRGFGAQTIISAPSRPPEGCLSHVADHLLETIAPVVGSARRFPSFPMLAVSKEDAGRAEQFWRKHELAPRRVVAIHPGSGGHFKCWPPERFASVSDRLTKRGFAVVLVSGPADDVARTLFTQAVKSGEVVPAVNLDLCQLAAVLAHSCGFLGNDSGISHLAAAVGTPAVAIYGPTDPRIWGVRGRRVALLQGGTLDSVRVAEVLEALDKIV